MNSAASARGEWLGHCVYCAEEKTVRLFKPGGHPPVQACRKCRPDGAQVTRSFAVCFGSLSLLIVAASRELAVHFLREHLEAYDALTEEEWASVVWDASTSLQWRADWRCKAVTLITDRPLPDGIE